MAWTDAARKAAAEARKNHANANGGTKKSLKEATANVAKKLAKNRAAMLSTKATAMALTSKARSERNAKEHIAVMKTQGIIKSYL